MAWFKCGGGGIPAALKNAMNTVFNKKFGTSTTYQPDGWPDNVNLMGPLEEKTVSGSVVAFSDGADTVPLKSCAVTIAPTLDGVSSVDVVQMGKNLCDPSDVGNYAISGTDGSISANPNSLANYNKIPVGTNSEISVSCGDYCDVRGIYCYGANDSFLGRPGALGETNQMTRTLVSGTTHIRVTFRKHGGGAVSPSDLTSAQIEFGSSSTTYSPYVSTTHTANLGRTIYGGSVDVVNGTGTDENGNDFTFTPVPIISRLGDNTMWGDGDLSVTYRRDIDLALAQ